MTLFTLVIVSGFCTVIALCRAGIQIFWADADRHFPHTRVTEVSAIVLLLGLCLLLTVVVQAPMDYLHDAARQLHDAGNYVQGVLPDDGRIGSPAWWDRVVPYGESTAVAVHIKQKTSYSTG